MRSSITAIMAILVLAALLVTGCSQAQPAPTAAPAKAAAPAPTSAPASAPAAKPTAAPAAAAAAPAKPTAAPAKAVAFPEKGKTITITVGWPAGGGVDVAARLIAPMVEKDLGTPVQVLNKAGAGGMIAFTDLARAKPDGYTLTYTINPSVVMTYLDPEQKATYSRKDFQPVANQFVQQIMMVVPADSPFKTVKDMVDAAKAQPEKVTVGRTSLGGVSHLAGIQFSAAANIKLATVQFEGDAPEIAAIIGRHLDFGMMPIGAVLSQAKAGQVRLLAIADKDRSTFAPEVPTLEELGYKVYQATVGGISAPGGTPKEIVSILAGSLKKAIQSDEHKKKMADMGYTVRFMDTAEYETYWNGLDSEVAPLIKLIR